MFPIPTLAVHNMYGFSWSQLFYVEWEKELKKWAEQTQWSCSSSSSREAVGVWEPASITQRSFLNTVLQFPVCETKESTVTFVSRWYATKPLTGGDVLAAAKSYLWLLIADQGLITLINGRGIWGPDLWGLLSVSVQLKRSRRRPEECVGPAGAISGLTADTS